MWIYLLICLLAITEHIVLMMFHCDLWCYYVLNVLLFLSLSFAHATTNPIVCVRFNKIFVFAFYVNESGISYIILPENVSTLLHYAKNYSVNVKVKHSTESALHSHVIFADSKFVLVIAKRIEKSILVRQESVKNYF